MAEKEDWEANMNPPRSFDRSVPAPNSAHKSLIISLIWDIALNATIPVVCYFLVKRYVSPSELTALISATAFPLLKSAYDLKRYREVDPVAVIVLLGIVTSILALFLGGDLAYCS
jgi:glycerol-3-phosphate acyltransferase PlsY